MNPRAITDQEFTQFQRFIFDAAGITLSTAKKALVTGRLAKRLEHCQVDSYGAYLRLLMSGKAAEEVQIAVDQLTTNETYFFREMKHFDFLREQALAARARVQPFRVWSAASSSGEEAYSIAMVLADCMETTPWEVLGSDISTKVLEGAARALYSNERGRHIPQAYLHRFCLKGAGEYANHLLIERNLRSRVSFRQVNLNVALPEMGQFDVVFLRNVLIYFSDETKRQVVSRVISGIKPGGHFFIGHSESLNGINNSVEALFPSIYRKSQSHAQSPRQ
ncbi:MAG: CheR family methyltransferase [Rhodoferax sp.]